MTRFEIMAVRLVTVNVVVTAVDFQYMQKTAYATGFCLFSPSKPRPSSCKIVNSTILNKENVKRNR